MIRTLALFAVIASLVTACGSRESSSDPSADESSASTYADGWDSITIIADWSKDKLDSTGHLSVSRNACGKEGQAVLELPTWNSLAQDLNSIIKEGPGSEEVCTPLPDSSRMEYAGRGTVDVALLPHGERALFETNAGQLCGKIKNRAAAQRLTQIFSQIVLLANKADCPNGWGH